MRVFLLLGVAVIFALAFADHHEGKHKHDKDDHHDHKESDHKKGEHHGKNHHHHHNESLPYHKIVPYISEFSFDLYRRIALDYPSENIVFSPASISIAFAFLSLGAKGQTHSQIMEGLRFNSSEISQKEIHDGFHHLQDILNDKLRELQLDSGNALFISKERKILQTFLDEAKRLYNSEAFSTDFQNKDEAKNQINSYVEKSTHGKIIDLMDSVDQDAIFVLINYIYFRGKWEHPFEEKDTKEGDFHVNENKTVKVDFMSRMGMYNIAENDEATVVSLPYKGDARALFILPKDGKLSEMEQNFNKDLIHKWKKTMHRRLTELFIPKFSISGTVNLKETLSKFGIVEVFSNSADLSGITGEANVRLSKAIHKAVISVDEKGTEAAGSTAFEAIPMMLPTPIKYDHPFIFTIYDYKSRTALFTGRVVNPQK